jgi:F0F1-type ATP synthase epsilon subunit
MPLTTVLKAGLIECIPVDQSLAHNNTFVFDQKTLTMAIGSGIAYIDGTQVEILASASLEHNQDITSLEAQASKLQSTITKLESDDKPRELESAIEELDRVKASIKFVSKAN